MSQDQIDELIEQFWSTDSDPVKIALLEEAIRLSDALGDTEQSFGMRSRLIEIAVFCGHLEKALVAFVWCLSQYDKDPEQYDTWDILWKYKWILDGMPGFPKVSRQQITNMLDDYQRRLQELNFGVGPAHQLRWKCFMRMGHFDVAREHYSIWQKSPHDSLGDCAACVADAEVELMMHLKENEQALTIARPILAGKLACAEVPQLTYGRVTRVLLRLEQLDEAEEMLKKGHRPLTKNPDFVGDVAELQLYMIRQGRFIKAVNTFEKCLPWAAATAILDARYKFYWASSLLMRSLVASGKQTRKLKLPSTLACYREDSQYDLTELADWFEQETLAIVDLFNQRNGNDYCTQMMQESRRLAGV